MIYGLIFTAGNETRFGNNIPKALSEINGKTILDRNIDAMSKFCDYVRVVCSNDNFNYFLKYGNKLIIIPSGKGCGDAVMRTLNLLNLDDEDTVFIQWGDAIALNSNIYSEAIERYDRLNPKLIIPVVKEQQPYVGLVKKEDRISVHFSKYDEIIDEGYHDQSIFYGNANEILGYLISFAQQHCSFIDLPFNTDAHYNKEIPLYAVSSGYTHKHGNELQFLDLLNETNIPVELFETNCITISFNSIEELNKIKTEYEK